MMDVPGNEFAWAGEDWQSRAPRLRTRKTETLPPQVPVPRIPPFRIHAHSSHTLRFNSAGACCLGTVPRTLPTETKIRFRVEGSPEVRERTSSVWDATEGLWYRPETAQATLWIAHQEGAENAVPLPAHAHHIRLDSNGPQSIVRIRSSFGFRIPSDRKLWEIEGTGWSVRETTKGKWVCVQTDPAGQSPNSEGDGALRFPQLHARVTWARYDLPAALEIVPDADGEPRSRTTKYNLRLVGDRELVVTYRAAGSSALVPGRIRLTPDKPTYSLELPPALVDGLAHRSLRLESDESCVNRRVHALDFPASPPLLCYPPLLVWKEAGSVAEFGVISAEWGPMDLQLSLPSSIPPDSVETRDGVHFSLTWPAPPPRSLADQIVLRDRGTGAVGAISILLIRP